MRKGFGNPEMPLSGKERMKPTGRRNGRTRRQGADTAAIRLFVAGPALCCPGERMSVVGWRQAVR